MDTNRQSHPVFLCDGCGVQGDGVARWRGLRRQHGASHSPRVRVRRALVVALVAASVVLADDEASAQSAENVALVINDASPASQRIGEYYARKRGLPPGNVIRLKTSTEETIERNAYTSTIENPIASAIERQSLQDRILYIVLTKGVPLRVNGTSGTEGTVASVDSELSLLYRKMTGKAVLLTGRVENPYFLGSRAIAEAQPFTHRAFDIFLVTRLDAFTIDEALALIDRALNASVNGQIVLDQRLGTSDRTGDRWLEEAARRLEQSGHGARVLLDNSMLSARASGDVLGYYSWGSNDLANRKRRFGLRFAPGAIAATFVSTDGRTFQEPPEDWVPSDRWNNPAQSFGGSPQTLTGDLIREGATGVAGHVAEPYLQSTVRPEVLFPAYLSGFNLAEAFYLAIPHLSWQSVVIGDPLCGPFKRNVLTRSTIEEPINPETEFPGIFAARRLELLRTTFKGVDNRALHLALKAQARHARRDTTAVREALEEAIAIAPSVISLQQQLATVYEQTGEHARARERYRSILSLQPNNVPALNNLAYSLAVNENALTEALTLAKRAVGLAPTNTTVLDTLAWIEHLRGNNEIAAKLLTAAIKLGTSEPDVHLHAALVYADLEAWAASETQLNETLRLNPAFSSRDDVARLKQRLESRRK